MHSCSPVLNDSVRILIDRLLVILVHPLVEAVIAAWSSIIAIVSSVTSVHVIEILIITVNIEVGSSLIIDNFLRGVHAVFIAS